MAGPIRKYDSTLVTTPVFSSEISIFNTLKLKIVYKFGGVLFSCVLLPNTKFSKVLLFC